MLKEEILCPSCKTNIDLQKVKINFNLCYSCNLDLSNNKEVMNIPDYEEEKPKLKEGQCKDCGAFIGKNVVCPFCSKKNPTIECENCKVIYSQYYYNCPECLTENKKRIKKSTSVTEGDLKLHTESLILTTTNSIDGYEVYKTLEIVTAECVFGMNIFRDFFAGIRDIFGGRSIASQKVLRDARKQCLAELKKEAYEIGANAVIGVSLDYSEFSGKAKSMLFLVASGTAVIIQKKNK